MKNEIGFPKIAIIGMGALVPGARTLGEFWHNILNGKDCIEDVPDSFWNHQDYYDANPFARDKTYCKRGGFLPAVEFDCVEFGIPPNVLESTSLNQLLALKVAKDTLIDARLLGDNACEYDKRKTGVILGANLGGSAFPLRERITLPGRMQEMLNRYGVDPGIINQVVDDLQDGFIDWNENSFPGFLPNIVSGRIVNRFDFGGPNFTVDAACASSLCAMMQAVHELQTHSCDVMLTGGVNVSNDPLSYLSFSKTPALSLKNQIRPYDKNADGMLVGDGIGMMALMRLEDAEAAGHRIYSVIAGLGSASDGKAKSIYAPRLEGQLLAISRAYENSEIKPEQISLIEGHGTGTPVGDACEVKGLREFFGKYAMPRHSIALGSVKSQIGHTTQAAGAASAIKVALALHHKVIPPSINIEEPNPDYKLDDSPFFLSTNASPWFQNDTEKRCAAVSSFGFGGINYHVLLEEHQAKAPARWQRLNPLPHLLVLAAADVATLLHQAEDLLTKLKALGEFDDESELLAEYSTSEVPDKHCRMALVAEDRDSLVDKLQKSIAALAQKSQGGNTTQWQLPGGIYFRNQAMDEAAKVVVMFSGQGAQYPEMGKTLALNFPEAHAAFAEVDNELLQQGKTRLSSLLFPNGIDADARQQIKDQLKRTEHVQPALAAFSAGSYDILKNLGFQADIMLGHSFGELTALWAAGALSKQDFFRLSIARGQAMQASKNEQGDPGAMLAVNPVPDNLGELIEAIEGVRIANLNSPEQVVISGSSAGIDEAEAVLTKHQLKVVRLPVSGAFHSSHMQEAVADFTQALKTTKFKRCQVPVIANLTAKPYRNNKNGNAASFRKTLAAHLEEPVLFRQSIETAYDQGGRIFVEIGPKAILSNFARATLKDKDVEILSLNPSADKDAVQQLLQLQAQLRVLGLNLHDDPYRIKAKTTRQQAKKVLVTLHGRHYFTPESLERINSVSSRGNTNSGQHTSEDLHHANLNTGSIANPAKPNASGNDAPRTIAASANKPVSSITNPVPHKDSAMPETNSSAPVFSADSAGTADPAVSTTAMPSTAQSPAPAANTHSGLSINDILQCQTANSHVQNQFYQTQSQQMQVLDKLMQHQQSLMQRLDSSGDATSQQLSKINTEHTQTFEALCQQSQYMFATHDAFLSNQNAILARLLGQGELNGLRQADQQPPAQSTPPAALHQAPLQQQATIQQQPIQVSQLQQAVAEQAQAGAAFASASNTQQTIPQQTGTTSAQPASTALSNAAANIPSSEELAETLLQVVSQSTGYPTDVIDMDMNLEADLGIDSIKRVEIFSSLNEKYPDYGEHVNFADLAELTTLEQIISYFTNLATAASGDPAAVVNTNHAQAETNDTNTTSVASPMTAAVAGAATPGAETLPDTKPSAPMTVEHFTQLLLDTIAKTTGYPVDVIDVDMDLEADLGVDSIKRVELFSVIQDQYEDLSKEVDPMDLMELKSLQQIVDYFAEYFNPESAKGKPGEASPTMAEQTPGTGTDGSKTDASVWVQANLDEAELSRLGAESKKKALARTSARYRIALNSVDIPELPRASDNFKGQHIVVTEDGSGNGWELCQQLKQLGATTTLLLFNELPWKEAPEKFAENDDVIETSIAALDDSAIASLVNSISARSPISGFVHINPLLDNSRSTLDYLQGLESQLIRTVFFISKHLKPLLLKNTEIHSFICIVTRIDGKLGFAEERPHSVIQGGYCGLLKSLQTEAPDLCCRNIDIAAEINSESLLHIILQELNAREEKYAEVGRTTIDARFVPSEYQAAIPVSAAQNTYQPDSHSVFLVSGGGRGVTARCIEQLAKHYQCRFIIIGRTPWNAQEPDWAANCKDEAALRQALLQQVRDSGEKPIPSKIDKELSKLLIQRDLQHTLNTIRAVGGKAIYISEDIAGTKAIQSKVATAVKKLGAITGIIHGAGNIADKLLEEKLEADFDLVYQSKVRGLETLLQCVDLDQLKFLVLFSSISGFYGQLGQSDYSLSNEILNKFALMLGKTASLAMLRAINWGPWDGGMVSPALKKVYEKFDVQVMPVSEGTDFLLDEFRFQEPGAEQILICPKNITKARETLAKNDANQLRTGTSRRT